MMERIRNLFGIGRVSFVDDSGDMQLIQVTEGAAGTGFADRVTDNVRRVLEYGFFSVPPIGSELLTANRGGDRTKPMVIGTSHRPSRPRGKQAGDSGIYNGLTGALVQMTADGLLIDCAGLPAIVRNATTVSIQASEKITMTAPTVEIDGDLHVTGGSTLDGSVATGTDAHVAGALTVAGDAAAANVDAAGEVTAGAARLTVLRNAYTSHHHAGIQRGSGTSDGPDVGA